MTGPEGGNRSPCTCYDLRQRERHAQRTLERAAARLRHLGIPPLRGLYDGEDPRSRKRKTRMLAPPLKPLNYGATTSCDDEEGDVETAQRALERWSLVYIRNEDRHEPYHGGITHRGGIKIHGVAYMCHVFTRRPQVHYIHYSRMPIEGDGPNMQTEVVWCTGTITSIFLRRMLHETIVHRAFMS